MNGAPSIAEVVYEFNDYPLAQNGATLSGAITVADEAAEDGILLEDEILRWEFVANRQGNQIGGSVEARRGFATVARNVRISPTEITVASPEDEQTNALSLIAFSGTGGDDGTLTWRRAHDRDIYSVAVTPHCMAPYDPRISACFLDFHFPLWSSAGPSDDEAWVIASRTVALLGDCNGDGHINGEDLSCATLTEQRDAILNALHSLPGDLDGDGAVSFADFSRLSQHFGSTNATYPQGNINLTGSVDFADFTILAANFGRTAAEVASVPEPTAASLALVIVLGSAVAYRSRRSS